MNNEARQARIRYLAERIWESEGRPEGQSLRHWNMACRLVEAEEQKLAQKPPSPPQTTADHD
ncbi:DUF2934 domain-containing protein [Frateuria aurantia]